MSRKYLPSSEPLRISAKQLFLARCVAGRPSFGEVGSETGGRGRREIGGDNPVTGFGRNTKDRILEKEISGTRFHMETLKIYELGSNQNDYTSALKLLTKIVM